MLDWLFKRMDGALGDRLSGNARLVNTGTGGLLAGTHVASNLGWRPVEALAVGDQVLTFDHGMQLITGLVRDTLVAGSGAATSLRAPVYIPADALYNRAPMWVMPDQGVLIESDLIEHEFGDPFAVVPACALDGYRGIERVRPGSRMELIRPQFTEDEVIYVEAGAMAYCPAEIDLLDYGTAAQEGIYRVLSASDARTLIVDMIAQEEQLQSAMPFMATDTHGSHPDLR